MFACLLIYKRLTFKHVILFQFTSIITTNLKHQHMQKWKWMELPPTSFLQTAQGNLSSTVTFPPFLLLNIIFFLATDV